jgi:predicted peptidase
MSWLRVGGLAAVVVAAMCGGGCGKMSYGEVVGSNPAGLQERGFLNRTVNVDGVDRKYGLFIPHAYTPAKQWPVIVFLHGVLEGGSDGESQMTVGLGPAIARMAGTFGFITIFPQSPGDWVGDDRARIVIAALDQVQKQYSTDRGCVTLTGLSNGGQGTWIVGGRYPDRFSALVPMCAYSAYDWVPQVAKLPIWCFHNSGDVLVGSGGTEEMCKRIKDAGGNPKFTKSGGMSHNCWDDAYAGGEVFQWMMSQRRAVVPVMGSTTGK